MKTRCKCGKEIRAVKGVKADECFACRTAAVEKAKPAPAAKLGAAMKAEAAAYESKKKPELHVLSKFVDKVREAYGVQVGDPRAYFASLSNADLAAHLVAAQNERAKRLAGVELLRSTVESAA